MKNENNYSKHIPDISISDFRHRIPVQLRFNDVDVLGHVNNTVYFSFYDTGKARYFSEVLKNDIDWQKVDTVIAQVNCSYISPIVFTDEIDVCTRCVHIGEKSMILEQVLVDRKTEILHSVCRTVMVGYNPNTKESEPISKDKKTLFNKYEGRDLSVF